MMEVKNVRQNIQILFMKQNMASLNTVAKACLHMNNMSIKLNVRFSSLTTLPVILFLGV